MIATTDAAPSVMTERVCDYCGLPTAPGPENEPAYCCYGCRFAASVPADASAAAQLAGPASALGLSIFCTINVVMLTMALWCYAEQPDTAFQAALGEFLRYGALAFSAPVLLLLGRPLLSHALVGAKRGAFGTDLLLAAGVAAAFAVSVFNTLRGSGHVYYEVGCVILTLVTLGRRLEAEGRARASQALEQLEKLAPETVRLCVTGGEIVTPRDSVVVGDILHVLAGERIPVDGKLRRGRGVVDERFFTGESAPVEKQPGDSLLGGSLNLDGDLLLETTAPPEAGALGRLLAAVRSARLSKGRHQRLSDAWSRVFFPLIAVVAVASLLIHGLLSTWEQGLLTALAVTLIACPCGLALATPLAVWTAIGAAARRGVLFRSGAALEAFSAVRAIRWDKTGTLTTGEATVSRVVCEGASEADVLSRAAALARASQHVYSQAVAEFVAEANVTPLPLPGGVRTIAGCGLRADSAGEILLLGSTRWLLAEGQALSPALSAELDRAAEAGQSAVALAWGGSIRGLFLLNEQVRENARDALAECQRLNLDQAVLTGDRASRGAAPALALGVPVFAELMPEDKFAAVKQAHERFGAVAMVGDGLNDAPALAAADVGIALGCGADVSRDSADVCLLSADLRLVPWSYDLSRRTVRTIRVNLAWSFGYNAIGVCFAAAGQLHPALAAGLMVLSGVMVLGNSLRLAAAEPETSEPETSA